VLLPGEPEDIARAERSQTGVPIDDELWAALKAMGHKLNLPPSLFAE
jgi:LDH2 family malate/lactate/ureidoglycolate dehydrogenase